MMMTMMLITTMMIMMRMRRASKRRIRMRRHFQTFPETSVVVFGAPSGGAAYHFRHRGAPCVENAGAEALPLSGLALPAALSGVLLTGPPFSIARAIAAL